MITLQYGSRITRPDDPLQKVSLERLHQGLTRPKAALRTQIERLRLVRSVDARQYARLKRELPYFVAAHFYPPYRRRENFSAIRHFVVDLDHFESAGLDRQTVRERLQKDARTLLLFTSPGGDGLKLLFQLTEKCFDPGIYSLFYKAFLQQLALEYGLEKVVDAATHDVARACFLSYDPRAYLNLTAEPVVLDAYFDRQDPDATARIHRAHQALAGEKPGAARPTREPPADEVLTAIKKRLNPNFRPRKKRDAYTPPELESIIPRIRERLAEAGISLRSAEPIHYGKKLVVAAGDHWAEINIFFGKRGFSVVKTTKSGSREELAELAYQLLHELLIA